MEKLTVPSRHREEMIDITQRVGDFIASKGWMNGLLVLFCPHTTCGLTINEGADPAVVQDMIRFFSSLIPRDAQWTHEEGNSDAHIKSSLLGASLIIPVAQNTLQLGTWQSVYLYEGDGPRTRSVALQWLDGSV